ncbi:MAG: ECF transporter S component [Lachnospiraceae bacterium]|nr:ECF transporter S component [Lachnospiraceae bacterium]
MTALLARSNLNSKRRAVLTALTVVLAVALPQVFHGIGAVLGIGSVAGEVFLPMHFPVLLLGILAGPMAGGIAGAASPLISFLLTGMPSAAMLPFMVIELASYGVLSGVLAEKKGNRTLFVFLAQVGGRGIKALAIAVAFLVFSNSLHPFVILTSLAMGLPGMALQLWLIPRIERKING